MAGRPDLWGGRGPKGSAAGDHSGRRRHDQQRLMVELELDDSLYQGALRAGADQGGLWQSESVPTMRAQHRQDMGLQRLHPSYSQYIAEPKARPQSRTPRDAAGKHGGGHQHQSHAKRLSSPYKLKQQILGSRNDLTVDSHHHQSRRSSHKVYAGAVHRPVRSSPAEQSPMQLVVESIRQNIRLRDQVIAHLQQELLGVLPLHRTTHAEKNVPQRVVKLLNKMRSVSLAVVEAVVYLSNELGSSGTAGSSLERDVLEQEFYSYMLQMTSDTDFLAYSPPIQRFFEDFEVNLMRNPFVDGLSLDSSEVMLCSCHHSAASGSLFCSASFSSSSLFRLMTAKLEECTQKMQQYFSGWQVLPIVRVGAALLHLVDLEMRFNAVQQLPRYLQPPTAYNDNRNYLQPSHEVEQTSFGYGTFEGEQMSWLARYNPHQSIVSDRDLPQGKISATEAWGGSVAKKLATSDSAPSLPRPSIPDFEPTRSKAPEGVTLACTSKEGSVRLASVSSSAWVEKGSSHEFAPPSAKESKSPNTPSTIVSVSLPAVASSPHRKVSVGTGESNDNPNNSRILLTLPLPDTAAEAKASSRSTISDRSASKKTSKRVETKINASIFIDAETQMTERATADDLLAESETAISIPTTNGLLVDSAQNEAIQECEMPAEHVELERRSSAGSVHDERLQLDVAEDHSVGNESLFDVGTVDLSGLPDRSVAHVDEHGILEDIETALNENEMVLTPEEINSSPECEIPKNGGAGAGGLGNYDCDFEYTSDDALSRIAQALNLLPSFSFFNLGLSLDEDQTSVAAIPMSNYEMTRSTEDTVDPVEGTAALADFSGESATTLARPVSSRHSFDSNGQDVAIPDVGDEQDVLNDVEMKVETISPPEDEFSYTSSIAKALSLLPQVSFVDTLVTPETLPGDQVAPSTDYALTTNRIIINSERPWQEFCLPPRPVADDLPGYFPASNSILIAEGTTNQEDSISMNRIFSLCQDIQVAAYDLSHWTSQREVESHVQTVSKTFSSSMGYSSPTVNARVENAPRYLERELKMLRRNFVSWKEACVERKRARMFVRRLAAKRRIRHFMLHHYQLRVQAREQEEVRLRFHAVLQLQQNWNIYRHNRDVSRRKAAYRSVHMAFHRALFFVGISQRRHKREEAKEKIVRWWRRQRCRIKKNKQRQEKAARERDRRVQALKELQRFLKEIVLRRRLKAAQETAKRILFEEQLKWAKAQRDAEIAMELHSKHHREHIADLDAKLEGLDRKWKASEEENAHLLKQRQHAVQQLQRLHAKKRRQFAAMKIQSFLKIFCLNQRLHEIKGDNRKFELKLREEKRAKEKLSVESQRHIGKSRAQARVLERKINRLSQQVFQAGVYHQEAIQTHEARERAVQQLAARKTIKAFIDARVLARRAEKDRRQLLSEQARIRAEKAELELMFEQDQFEQRRAAFSIALELSQQLSQLKHQSDALAIAKDQLAREKQQEIDLAARQLEHNKVESSMQQIASWVSGKMQVSKFKKQQAEICASAERDLEEMKQQQRRELETTMREVTSIKVSNLAHHTVVKHRNSRAMAIARMEEYDRSIRQKAIAERTQAQLVQIVIEVKLISEREGNYGVIQALDGMKRLQRAMRHKTQRLMHLQRMNSARKIQLAFRRWMHKEKIKHTEKKVTAQLVESLRRRAFTRRLQAWWRYWAQERRRQREQEMAIQAHLEDIRRKANARKIQLTWRRWRQHRRQEKERKRIERQHFVSAYRIQRKWRKWRQLEREKAERIRIAHDSSVQLTQQILTRCRQAEDKQRQLHMRRETCAQKLQKLWRQWYQWRCLRESSAKRIQQRWKKWDKGQKGAERVRRSHVLAATVIQRSWCRFWRCKRRRHQEEAHKQRRQQMSSYKIQMACYRWWQRRQKERNEAKAAERIQRAWRCWKRELGKKLVSIENENKCALRIQKHWRSYEQLQRDKAERLRLQNHERTSAVMIEKVWIRHRTWQKMEVERRGCSVLKIQKQWRRWHQPEQARRKRKVKLNAQVLQQNKNSSAIKIQKGWRQRQRRVEQHERDSLLQAQTAISVRIQRNWGMRQHQRKMENERLKHLQHVSALRIQGHWLKWHHHHQEELEKERIRQEQDASSLKIHRNWGISHHRRKVSQERIRHRESMNALKIQKQWRRWRTLRREKQIHRNDEDGKGINVRKESVIQVPDQQSLPAPELNKTSEQLQREQEERQQKLDEILYRFSGRCIARTVSRFHRKNRRQVNAATRIEAIWRGRVCRMQYEEALEAKRQEEARIYLLKLSVFATKVQVCWRQWQVSIRQARRLAVKAEEMRLIEEEKARARKRVVAKQILSSAIQPLMLACTRKMDHAVEDSQACESVEAVGSGQDVGSFQDQIHRENEVESMKVSEKISIRACVDNVVNDWSHRELPHILASTVDRVLSSHDGIVQGQMGELDQDGAHRENEVKPIEAPKEDMTPDGVDEAVKDWSHRQLPYILTSSVNRVLFCQNEDAKGQNGESSQDNEVDSMKVPEKVAGRACVGEVVNDWSCYELPQILMNSVNRVVCCHDEGAKVCIGVPGPDEVQSTKVASNKTSEQLQREQEERQQKLDEILYRFSGRCIARTVSRFHRKNRRQVNAATRIEAIWRGRVCRMQYEEALEAKRQEEARIYLLKLSVFATKVQVCWRQWQVSIRQARRLAVKAEEMRLIEEEKARARKRVVARRISAAMRIQPLLLACTRKMDHADEDSNVAELSQVAESSKDDVRKEAKDEAQDDEGVELMKVVEEDVIRDSVDEAVKDWSHRELPHILTSSVNRVIFCHDGAVVLQRFVRGCQRRNLLHFYFQRPLPISDLGNDGEANFQHFHFYFKRSKAWLELGRHKQHGNLSSTALPDSSSDLPSRLRLRFDGQMTRKLLQMFEPDAAHSTCELKEALREIAADACPIFQSPACLQSNSSPTLNLRYHEVGETDLPHFIALMREMSKRRAQVRRDQLLEVDTQAMAISPVVSSPSSPLSSAPSSPMLSQRTKREPTIFDAVENASVEEVIFLQKRSADLGAIEPKTQRNALHMLAFSTESYRFRAEMLEFLLRSEVNLNVNATDCHGDTPLMLYASMGHLEFMKELLKRGADIQLTNAKGQNVLHRACEKDQVEICGFLQQLMMAKKTVTGGATTAETISALPLGFSLHSPDSTGRYPLHILVEQGFVECAKQLLVPAEVNTEWNGLIQAQSDEQGRTALHLAVLAHDAGMTTFLLLPGGGADIDAIDDLRRTPLHYAVESPAALPIISRLAQQGADLNMADERGDTPLHWAAFSGRTAVMQHLLSLGADPTLVNSDWESPAQIAAAYGQLDGMRILLQAQRRYEAASKAESMEQQRPPTRLASEKTVFERLEEAQNEVHQKQAAQSFRASAVDSSPDAASSNAPRSAQPPISGYWEELHQDVQLVEESGQFSSEDEADLLFDHDSDDDIPTF